MIIIRVGRRKRTVVVESQSVSVSWTNDYRLADGERFSIVTLPDAKGHMYRVELSEQEVIRLNRYREEKRKL
jgi:hypothetical protein